MEERIEQLHDDGLDGAALVHLNAYLEAYLCEEIEAYEAEELDQYSADINYHRARERSRNQHVDDACGYELLDLDAVDGIDNDVHLFQVIEGIVRERRSYAHELEAYSDEAEGYVGYGLDIVRSLE